jgi:hypothetical protein
MGGWTRFRNAGLLWWVNRSLHMFGWSLVAMVDESSGEVVSVEPRQVGYRGFSREAEEEGFAKLTRHMGEMHAIWRDQVEGGG